MTTPPPTGGPEVGPPPAKQPSLAEGWAQFNAEIPSESDAMDCAFRHLQESGMIQCPRCSCSNVDRLRRNRLVYCKHCGKQWSFTARTFFDHIRKARPWVAAIWLMGHGYKLNASQLEHLTGVGYPTAWTILHKISFAFTSQMGTECEQVQSSNFYEAICKRSRETPARAHPLAEQQDLDAKQHKEATPHSSTHSAPDTETVSDDPGTAETSENAPHLVHPSQALSPALPLQRADCAKSLSDASRVVYDCLSKELIHFDMLQSQTEITAGNLSAVLTLLELDGLVSTVDGNWYKRAGLVEQSGTGCRHLPTSSRPDSAIGRKCSKVIEFIRALFHGISRKYVQPYLSRHWCNQDRVRLEWSAAMRACCLFGPITYDQILQYVSPVEVTMFSG